MVLSLKRGGYWEPGVEMKLSAKLSTGECSYLIWGVVAIAIDFGLFGGVGLCLWMVKVEYGVLRVVPIGESSLPSIDVCTGLAHIEGDTVAFVAG